MLLCGSAWHAWGSSRYALSITGADHVAASVLTEDINFNYWLATGGKKLSANKPRFSTTADELTVNVRFRSTGLKRTAFMSIANHHDELKSSERVKTRIFGKLTVRTEVIGLLKPTIYLLATVILLNSSPDILLTGAASQSKKSNNKSAPPKVQCWEQCCL